MTDLNMSDFRSATAQLMREFSSGKGVNLTEEDSDQLFENIMRLRDDIVYPATDNMVVSLTNTLTDIVVKYGRDAGRDAYYILLAEVFFSLMSIDRSCYTEIRKRVLKSLESIEKREGFEFGK